MDLKNEVDEKLSISAMYGDVKQELKLAQVWVLVIILMG